jgi:hypothetical protein
MRQSTITRDVEIKETEKENSKVIGQLAEKEVVDFIELKGTKVLIKTESGIEGYIPKGAQRKLAVKKEEVTANPIEINKQLLQKDPRTNMLKVKADVRKKELETEKHKRTTYYIRKDLLFKLAQLYDLQDEGVTKKDFINAILEDVIDSYKDRGFVFEEFDPDNKKHIKRI